MTLYCERQPTCYYATGPITSLRAQNCLQTQSSPGLCFISLCGKLKLEPKKGAERPSSLRGATLQAIHHLAAACLSSFPLCLSPTLSLSSAPLFLSKKKPLLPSKNPSSFCPPSSSAAVSRSLPNPGGEKLRFCYGVWVSDLSIASNPA